MIMKTKLQALLDEQKELTSKIQRLLNNINYIEFNPDVIDKEDTIDPKKVYIKGHPTRGAEVIKMLEDLGGVNAHLFKGSEIEFGYYITKKGRISNNNLHLLSDYTEIHLSEEVNEVDPPKEEIELIEGEVYIWLNCAVFIYLKNDKSICYDFDHVAGVYMIPESTIRKNISEYIPATQKNIDYIFDVIEKAGKHFDKKNMRLLDVEEWSCERGSPFIRRIGEDIWKCDIFWQKSNNGGVYAENGNIHKVAIPYNDQTKHLINTNKIPDKHYKFVDKL